MCEEREREFLYKWVEIVLVREEDRERERELEILCECEIAFSSDPTEEKQPKVQDGNEDPVGRGGGGLQRRG